MKMSRREWWSSKNRARDATTSTSGTAATVSSPLDTPPSSKPPCASSPPSSSTLTSRLLELSIETLVGSVIKVLAYPTDTLHILKSRIAFQEGIPPKSQTLLLSNKILSPETGTLKGLGISNNSKLRLVTSTSTGLPRIHGSGSSLLPACDPVGVLLLDSSGSDLDSGSNSDSDQQIEKRESRRRTGTTTPGPRFLILFSSSKSGTKGKSPISQELPLLADSARDNIELPPIPGRRLGSTWEDRANDAEKETSNSPLSLPAINQTPFNPSTEKENEVDRVLGEGRKVALLSSLTAKARELRSLEAEIQEEGRHNGGGPQGLPPYTHKQLQQFVTLKLQILTHSHSLRLINRIGVSPTVVANRIEEPTCARPSSPDQGVVGGCGDGKGKPRGRERCGWCRKRLSIASRYTCRCGNVFCAKHRYSETHHCSYNYKLH